jgi:hypothetical protein
MWSPSLSSGMAMGRPGVSNGPHRSHIADILSSVRAGIRDRTTAYIVSENSWPLFLYEGYEASVKNLERGLMKSKLLVMVCANFIFPNES